MTRARARQEGAWGVRSRKRVYTVSNFGDKSSATMWMCVSECKKEGVVGVSERKKEGLVECERKKEGLVK